MTDPTDIAPIGSPSAAILKWVECEPGDERPTYGPSCPGPDSHRWFLGIEEGRIAIGSGCEECDLGVQAEDWFMEEIAGTLTPNVDRQADEVWFWWEFAPDQNGRNSGSSPDQNDRSNPPAGGPTDTQDSGRQP